MLTVPGLTCGLSPPPHSSWVCQRQWSQEGTHTDRTQPCWCTLHFCITTSGCLVLNIHSHLRTEGERPDIKTQLLFFFNFFCCCYRAFVLSYQCRPCGTGPGCIHQSSHRCNLPEPARNDHSHSHSGYHTPLLAIPQKPCMSLGHQNTKGKNQKL